MTSGRVRSNEYIAIVAATGAVQLEADPATASYSLVLPAALGPDGSVFVSDASGALTLRQLTEDDILPGFAIASFTKTAPNGSQTLYERGDILTGTAISASYTGGTPDTGTINNNASPAFGDTGDQSPTAWTFISPFATGTQPNVVQRGKSGNGFADPTWSPQLDVDLGAVNRLASITITWTRRLYWGRGAAGVVDQAGMQALNEESNPLDVNRQTSFQLSPANEKVYFALPIDYGTPSFSVDGFGGGFSKTTSAVSFATLNAAALTSDYDIWESDQLLTGTKTFVVT